ncbi:MAG: hypothetical protein R2731_12230 [Nocardioides sp.]
MPFDPLIARLWVALTVPRPRDERGDVPGWVMITVMSAGLVVVLWQVAGDRLGAMLSAALDSVK